LQLLTGATDCVIGFVTKRQLDATQKDAYTVTVAVSDREGLSTSANIDIKVTDVNQRPTVCYVLVSFFALLWWLTGLILVIISNSFVSINITYKLKIRMFKEKCCKQCRQVKLKGTTTKWRYRHSG